ncbi:MAG: hypothetical protein HAW59_04155, partial [Betaproteobacteria bacterium]|nr:hypothetical protein [Betaproteobacteria bacterium]
MKKLLSLCFVFALAGCASPKDQVLNAESQVALRSIQTRAFDTTDKEK